MFSSFRLLRGGLTSDHESSTLSPGQRDFQRKMAERLTGSETPNKARMMSFSVDNRENNNGGVKRTALRVIQVESELGERRSRAKKGARHIPQVN